MSKYINYTIGYGDTLQNISQDTLGDSDRWIEVAMLNNLVFPFIVEDSKDKVSGTKAIGEIILLPMEQEYTDVIPVSEMDRIYENALGEDLSLFEEDTVTLSSNETGELSSNVYGDLKTVRGLQNLKQAYILRLATPLGTLLHHPSYGSKINEILGKKSSTTVLQKIKIEVERVIRSDARTEDIKFEQATLDGDTIRLVLTIKPIEFDAALKMSLTLGEGGVIEWG